jgi:outer membrane lipoprotein LolB
MLNPLGKTKDIMYACFKIRIFIMITQSNLAKSLGLFFLSLMIANCSTTAKTPASTETTAPATIPVKDRQTSLNTVHNWRINGKIAVQSARDSGSATVNWVQKGGQYSISLMGPLGSNGLKLAGRPGHVTLQTSDGKSYSASSPEELLAKRWGFHVPVSNMNYWIRGLPVPGPSAKTQFDHYGRLTHLVQQGWSVQYQNYTHVSRVDLPQMISITSPSLKVKIIVYQWNIG